LPQFPLRARKRFESIHTASVLLVGCGTVGTVIAKHLCASDTVEELVLADIDTAATDRAVEGSHSKTARALSFDASRAGDLRRAMRGCDVVVNASLPRFNRGIKEAALASGIHYMDLTTESSDPFVDSETWNAQGLTALVTMGGDPGLSDVFARRSANGMDHVDSIRIRDGDTGFSPESFVEETTTPSRIWRDGVYETVPPFGEPEVFEFPPPLGPLAVYSVDHEEVDSLPRFIGKGALYVDFELALDGGTVRKLMEFQELRGQARTPEDIARLRRQFFAAIPKPADLTGRVTGDSGIFVEVRGMLEGRRRVHTFYTVMNHPYASANYGATATAYLTGTGAAVGALFLVRGQVRESGVLPPESLDPSLVFPMIRERGVEVVEHVELESPNTSARGPHESREPAPSVTGGVVPSRG
jgi:saccharopine dehydrogenase-like NADP-dependent oxidoreductase